MRYHPDTGRLLDNSTWHYKVLMMVVMVMVVSFLPQGQKSEKK